MKNIVVVDDEPLIANGIAMLLRHCDLPLQVAAVALDAQAALQACAAQPIDIVISDINMPGMNGIELLRRIHDAQPACQLIVLTGFGTLSYAKEAMALGVQHFLEKPLVPADLLQALAQTIARSSERQMESRLLFKQAFERFVRYRGTTPLAWEAPLPPYLNLFDGQYYQAVNDAIMPHPEIIRGAVEGVGYLLAQQPIDTQAIVAASSIARGMLITAKIASPEAVLEAFCLAKRHLDKVFYYDKFTVVAESALRVSQNVDETLYPQYQTQLLAALKRCEVAKAIQYTRAFFATCGRVLYPVQLLRLQVNALLTTVIDTYQLELDESLKDYAPKVMLLDRVQELEYLVVHTLSLLRQGLDQAVNATLSQQVNLIIERDYAQENLSLKWIAANLLHVNPEHLGKTYYRETGQRFNHYLAAYRIGVAKQLLLENYKVYEVASLVGFGDTPEYFVQTFRKYTGITPKQYVTKMQQDGAASVG